MDRRGLWRIVVDGSTASVAKKKPSKPTADSAPKRKAAPKRPSKAKPPAKRSGAAAKRSEPAARRKPPVKPAETPPAKHPPANSNSGRGAARRESAARQSRDSSRSVRDIGDIPAVANPQRRAAALACFETFCLTYFSERFKLEFSPDHCKVIGKIQTCINEGGLFAQAMPRGSGKTTLAEIGCVYALLGGRHDFLVLIGADKESATDMLDSIKGELEGNELLAEDFPEVCFPIAALEGISHRCKGQTFNGERTQIAWTSTRITLPTIPGSQASGITIRCAGITGRIRGMKHRTADGRNVRPTLVIIDDPQTDEAADSPTLTAKLERTVKGAILGLAGPGRKIAVIMPCTVIRRGDMADRLLDPKLNPEFQGERCQMLYALPERLDLWEAYNEIRVAELQAGRGLAKATAHYRRNLAAMQAGAVVAWTARYNADEHDALQHALNLRLADLGAFEAEYQNNPLDESAVDDADICTAERIAAKTNGFHLALAPAEAMRVTIGCDVQKQAIYWLALATADDFTGWVLDYGAWPDQGLRYFALRNAPRTIAAAAAAAGLRGAGLEGRLFFALRQLIETRLAPRVWKLDGGGELRAERILIDSGWQGQTVADYIRQSPVAGLLWPTIGKSIKAADKPMSEWAKKPGERAGDHWRISNPSKGKAVKYVLIDTNHWKTFTHARLAMAPGDRSGHSLYKQTVSHHQMLADHLAAEHPVRNSSNGRDLVEWREKPAKPDNHLFDCYVGACVAASMGGACLPEQQAAKTRPKSRPRRKVTF